MSTKKKNERIVRDQQLISGIEKHLGKSAVIVVNGEKTKASELLAMLEQRIEANKPVAPAKAAWTACVNEEQRVVSETDPSVTGLLAYLRLMYAGSPEVLADFGIVPKQRRELTSAEKAERAAKARATRRLRNTLGKRQKAHIVAPGAVPNAAPS